MAEQFPTISEVRELKAWGRNQSPSLTIFYILENLWGGGLVNTKVMWGGERA